MGGDDWSLPLRAINSKPSCYQMKQAEEACRLVHCWDRLVDTIYMMPWHRFWEFPELCNAHHEFLWWGDNINRILFRDYDPWTLSRALKHSVKRKSYLAGWTNLGMIRAKCVLHVNIIDSSCARLCTIVMDPVEATNKAIPIKLASVEIIKGSQCSTDFMLQRWTNSACV